MDRRPLDELEESAENVSDDDDHEGFSTPVPDVDHSQQPVKVPTSPKPQRKAAPVEDEVGHAFTTTSKLIA